MGQRHIWLAIAVVLALSFTPFATAEAQWDRGIYEDPGWFDDNLADNDWFYDSYDPTFYDYGPYDWYDFRYSGLYDNEWGADDWYFDEYETAHWDATGYDDPGEAGLWDW